MRDRIVRTIVFFDLPNFYAKDKRNYLRFRKYLLGEGFIMMQESVYSKLVLNNNQSELLLSRLRKNAPVSMPIAWNELDKIKPNEITIYKAIKRLKKKDPWKDFFTSN